MKTIQNILSVTLKSILFLSLVLITSCSKDDDLNPFTPNENAELPANLVGRVFEGPISYESADGSILVETLTGESVISGTRGNYTISFNNSIPSITGIDFYLVSGMYIYNNPNDEEESIALDQVRLAIDLTINGNSTEHLGQ